MASPAQIRRIAMVSFHTSPLEQPGTGDAGGLNVYVAEVARQLAARGVDVDIFTRAASAGAPAAVEMVPGVLVRHVLAGPYEGLATHDLAGQLRAFATGVMHTGAAYPPGHYDLVHSHYWLSGQVGRLAADGWGVPHVHTMHTMARVKNRYLATEDAPEPLGREIGEARVVGAADMLVANTDGEARELIDLYAADPATVRVVRPGVDLDVFRPGDQRRARAELGLPAGASVLLFVGRIQPLKGPDVLIRAARVLLDRHPHWSGDLLVCVLGGPSGSGLARPATLEQLSRGLGLGDQVRFVPPVDRGALATWYRAADVVAVPSRSESFGLVALEAQACGVAVVAAEVGGLPTAVGDAGLLVPTHDAADWADAIESLLLDPTRRALLSTRGVQRASRLGWAATTDRLLAVYAQARHAHRPPVSGESAALAGTATAVTP